MQAKKPTKRRFRPSQAKTTRYVSQLFYVLLVFTILRGVSEREWFRANPHGTKDEFNEHFKTLSLEKLQVRREDQSQQRSC